MALNHLRSRKQLEDVYSKRLSSLSTLESTLISVEAAAGDIEVRLPHELKIDFFKSHLQIMKVYESSTATLRAILTHPSLQRESIDRTLDALADANTDAKEIDDAVRFGADVSDQIDDADLEMELNRLIADAEQSEPNEHRKVKLQLGDEKLTVPQEELVGDEGIKNPVDSFA